MNNLISFLVANKASIAFIVKKSEVDDYLRLIGSKIYTAKPVRIQSVYADNKYVQNERIHHFSVGSYVIGNASYNSYQRATINLCVDTVPPTDLSLFDVVYNSEDDTVKYKGEEFQESRVPRELIDTLAKMNATVPYVILKRLNNYCEANRLANSPMDKLIITFLAKASESVAFEPVDGSSVRSLVKFYLHNLNPIDFVYPLTKDNRNSLQSSDVSFATDSFMKRYLNKESEQEGNVIIPLLGKYNKTAIPRMDTVRYVGKYNPKDFNTDIKVLTRAGKVLEISTPEVSFSVSDDGVICKGRPQAFFDKYTKPQNSYLVNYIKRRL